MITNYIKHKGNIAFYVKNKSKSGGKLNRSKDKDVYKYILEKNKNNSHNVEINDYFHNKKILDSRYKEYEKNISKQNRNIKNIDIKKIYTLPLSSLNNKKSEKIEKKVKYDEARIKMAGSSMRNNNDFTSKINLRGKSYNKKKEYKEKPRYKCIT